MSTDVSALVSDNLDLWTSAIERRPGAGRGDKKVRLVGIERLRALILDLAVRGKLVPQNASDEPVGALLAQIDAGRAKLADAGFVRGAKAGVNRTPVTQPFPIPPSWLWVRLDRLGAIVGGGTPSANDPSNFAEPGEGIPWLTPADLSGFDKETIGSGKRDLTSKGAESSSARLMPAGTVLFTSRAPIGYVAVAANALATNQGFKSVVPSIDGMSRFIALVLKAFAEEIDANASGTTFKEVSGKIVEAIPFPLPPLAEQTRIVAKVDELMALCDALETQSASALKAHQSLVETLLATLANATDPADLSRQWARLEGHFDDLFTTEASIDAMKQTVLELAVRGKLAEQNADDEPASEFITRLANEKAALVSSGSIKKPRSTNTKMPTTLPFPLPSGWEWSSLGAVCYLITDGEHLTPKRIPDENGIPLVTAKNVRAGVMDYAVTDFVSRETAEACWQRCKPQENDILLVSVGATIGRSTIVTDYREMVIVRSVTLIRASAEFVPFLSSAIGSQMMQRQIWNGVRQSAQPGLYLNVTNGLLIPIPPLAEQERIVAKLDQLMALCDTLKARLNGAAQTQKHLANAVVERAAA